MAKKSKKKTRQTHSDATQKQTKESTSKAELEGVVNAVQSGESYKKPLRDIGAPVYAKHKDLEQLEEKLTETLDNKALWVNRKMSQFDQAQQRTTENFEQKLHNLRGFMVVLAILVLVLIGVAIWMIVAMNNLSAQVALKKSRQQTDTTVAMTSVTEHNINLDDYGETNLNLIEAGEYTLTGSTKNQILITANDDVAITLANVDIQTEADAAIKLVSQHNLTINLADSTTNNLISNGAGPNGGTIHSNHTAVITGNGKLTTTGRQKYSSGITTKQPYFIDGGDITIIGSDMLQPPENTVNPLLKFDLTNFIKNGSLVQIQNPTGTSIERFVATQDFRTLMVSKPNLDKGNYSLLVDGQKISEFKL